MARRSEHSLKEIKEMVLNAAEAIIIADGAEALTVRRVALDIGYTVGSIYMVFANMQDVLMQIKGRTLDELVLLLEANTIGDNVEQQIGALADSYLKFANEHYNRWRIIFEPVFKDQESLPDWYEEKIGQIFAPIEDLFKRLSPEKTEEQAHLAARALWCGVHGVCVLALNGSLGRTGVENSQVAVRLLVDSFIKGWKA